LVTAPPERLPGSLYELPQQILIERVLQHRLLDVQRRDTVLKLFGKLAE
jgi:hypothetical protein